MLNPYVKRFIESGHGRANGIMLTGTSDVLVVIALFPIHRSFVELSFDCQKTSNDDMADLISWISTRRPENVETHDVYATIYYNDGNVICCQICQRGLDSDDIIDSYDELTEDSHVGRIWRWSDEEWLSWEMSML